MASGRLKLSADVVLNVAFAALNVAFIWLLTRLSTGAFAPAALALFLLVRRYSGSLSCFIHLGGPAFQVRYMAMHAGDRARGDLVTLLVTAFYACAAAAVIAFVAVFRDHVRRWFLPIDAYPSWALWCVVVLSAEQLFHFVVICNLLVYRRIALYNLFRIAFGTGLYLVPLVFLRNPSVYEVMWWTIVGGLGLLLAGNGFFITRALMNVRRLQLSLVPWLSRELLTYGPPRSAINLMDSLLFVVGPWLIRDDVEAVAQLLTIFVFVQATSIVVLPINDLAMVVGANRVGEADAEGLGRGTRMLLETLFGLSVVIAAAIYPYRDALFRLGISRGPVLGGIDAYSPLLSCIVPLTVYNGLKGIIEMRWKAPRNLASLLSSTALGVATFYSLRRAGVDDAAAVLWASTVMFWTLGVFTVIAAWPLLTGVRWAKLLMVLMIAATLAGANFLALDALGRIRSIPAELALITVNVALLTAAWWLTAKPAVIALAVDAARRLRSRSAAVSGG